MRNEGSTRLPASHLFIFIGAMPRSELVADIVELDDRGFVLTGPIYCVTESGPKDGC